MPIQLAIPLIAAPGLVAGGAIIAPMIFIGFGIVMSGFAIFAWGKDQSLWRRDYSENKRNAGEHLVNFSCRTSTYWDRDIDIFLLSKRVSGFKFSEPLINDNGDLCIWLRGKVKDISFHEEESFKGLKKGWGIVNSPNMTCTYFEDNQKNPCESFLGMLSQENEKTWLQGTQSNFMSELFFQ